MKRTILYLLAFIILIFLFRFISTRVDTEMYDRLRFLEEWRTSASVSSPDELLNASLKAYGGIDKIGAIKELHLRNRIRIFDHEQNAMNGRSNEFYRFPDQVRVNFRFETEEVTHLYNGLEAWTVQGSEVTKAPDFIAEGLRRSVKHFPTTLLLSALDERSFLAPLERRQTENDRTVYSLKITDRENDYSEIWIDGETLLMNRIDYVLYSSLGADTMSIFVSDYRPVDGIQTAFAATIYYDGERAQETIIDEVQSNPNLPDSIFALENPGE